jgi:N-acetylglucosamine-6-sulfatase
VRTPAALRRRPCLVGPSRLLCLIGVAVTATVTLSACTAGGSPSAPSAPSSSAASPGAGSRPNVVFVLTDDLAMNLVQYMPHVLALEKAGTTFNNYTVTDSLCCPSRSSIFSGKFPHDTGVFTNTGADGGFNVFHSRGEESATFATALQQVGYRTAMMGKYLNGYNPKDALGGAQPYVPPGWNEWDVAGNGYPEFNYDLNQNHQVTHYGKTPADYLTDVLSNKGAAFITASAAAHTPFLLEVATFAPHAPYTPAPQDANAFPGLAAPRGPAFDTLPSNPPQWLAGRTALTGAETSKIDTDFRKRVQDVQSVDRMIANLEATLTKTGQASNTDIVFSSDNGYHMGEYRLNPGKMTAFDTDIHVPLVAAGPGIKADNVASAPVQNIDLAPTFEALGGAPTPGVVDGRSLAPLLSGPPATDWRTAALVEHHGPDTDPTDPDHPAKNSGNPTTYQALRTTTATYVEYTDGTTEYYDRSTDPGELRNTAATLPPATLSALHTDLAAMTSCHGQTACWDAGHLVH